MPRSYAEGLRLHVDQLDYHHEHLLSLSKTRRLSRLSSGPTEDKRACPARGAATDDTGLQLGLVIKHRFPDLEIITPVNVATSCYKVSLLSSVLLIPLVSPTRTYSRGTPCKTPLLRIRGLQSK